MNVTTFNVRCFGISLAMLPNLCWGWGGTGHCAIAQIAAQHLTPNARNSVRELLDGRRLADIASWADEIRKQPDYKWSDVQHCSHITFGFDTFIRSRDCPLEGCAVSAIDRFARILQDPSASRDRRIDALKFLVHFVGDIHNPLHLAEKGKGVGTDLRVTFFGERASLHRVWDESIIAKEHKSWEAYARELDERITPEQIKHWSQLDPAVWATESYRLARSVAYVIPTDGQLGQSYYDKCLPVVDERLSQAGVRLGLLLNFVFSHPSVQPAATMPATSPAATSGTLPEDSSEIDESSPPVVNPANGHYYEAIAAPGTSWVQAKRAAERRRYHGLRGHLATVTSEEENDFIVGSFGGWAGTDWHWLGGYQDYYAADYHEPDGGWRWITGEPWDYTSWAKTPENDEPNNSWGVEDVLMYSHAPARWNDANSDIAGGAVKGYILEYEDMPATAMTRPASRGH